MRKCVTLLIILAALAQSAPAAKWNIRFKHLTLEDGLSQSMILDILQDSKGFMWFATQDGLNKYDGYSFHVYRPDPQNPHSLQSNIISALEEDTDGAIWVGTNFTGLDRYDRETDRFISYSNDPTNPRSLSNNFVNAILVDGDGVLWAGTGLGLNRFHRDTGDFTRYLNIPGDNRSLSHNNINIIYEDKAGTIWIGTNAGLNKFDRQSGTFTVYRADPSNPESLRNDFIPALLEDHSGEFWVGTGFGLHRFNRETGECVAYLPDASPGSLSDSNITSIAEDHGNILWIGTASGGINTFDRRSEKFSHYRAQGNNPESISSDTIQTLYVDASGLLWIGTGDAALDRFDREIEKFRTYSVDPESSDSLSHNFVYSFSEDSEGMIWLGTNGGGLNKFDPYAESFTRYNAEPNNRRALSSNLVQYVYVDGTDTLWIGTNGGGLNRFNREDETFTRFLNRRGDAASLSNNSVKLIKEDSFGLLWVGTLGGALNVLDRAAGRFTRYQNNPNQPGSFRGVFIRSICETRDRTLWIGTTANGLNRFNRESKTFTNFPSDPNNPNSLSNNNIMCIYECAAGNLWIGTFGGGLNKFEPAKGAWTHFRQKDGLPNDVVYGLLEDEEGCLWLSTNKGLSKFNPGTGRFKNYTYQDGLQSNEFNGGSYFKSTGGEMYFGGVKGFNRFLPRKVEDNKHVPPIVITDFKVFNQRLGIGGDSPLKKHITETRAIHLPYNRNVFSFNFVALDYIIPQKNQYMYMMENFDKDWVRAGSSSRFAGYTNLDPGEYTFHVRGSNNDGVWNETGASIRVVIAPPYWETWWFRLLGLAFLLLLIGLIYRVRMKSISQKTRLETEMLTARDAQMSIMPQEDPHLAAFEVSGVCVPAFEVGGDFFDYLWMDHEQSLFGIAIGDVSGKAMKAAMTAVMSSGMLYSKIDCYTSVQDIMTQINRPLFLKTDRRMFTALCLASIDIEKREMTFSNAGLSQPLLKTGRTSGYVESVGPRFPLGSFIDNSYQETRMQLKQGDVVVFFTDGIPEAQNFSGEFYGYDTLKNLLDDMDTVSEPAVRIKERIIEDVKRFAGSAPQHDDMTVVVLKVLAG